MADRRDVFWVQVPGWLLLLYLVYAQMPAAFDYELGVRMGTQEPAELITEVGAAFWYGFAFADLLIYIPLFAVGLVGFWRGSRWGQAFLGAALGITIYWPVVALAAAVRRCKGCGRLEHKRDAILGRPAGHRCLGRRGVISDCRPSRGNRLNKAN
jgi:hypothetical protein